MTVKLLVWSLVERLELLWRAGSGPADRDRDNTVALPHVSCWSALLHGYIRRVWVCTGIVGIIQACT